VGETSIRVHGHTRGHGRGTVAALLQWVGQKEQEQQLLPPVRDRAAGAALLSDRFWVNGALAAFLAANLAETSPESLC
jgi:hypothetical protein